jgi:hypothetical protein
LPGKSFIFYIIISTKNFLYISQIFNFKFLASFSQRGIL